MSPPPFGGSKLSSYAFENQYTQHVNYIGEDLHIHELWWDSSGWHAHDLTAAASAPSPTAIPIRGSKLSSYVFQNIQYTQHVNYIGEDWHVYELWRDSSGWHFSDLTAAASAPPSSAVTLSSYVYANTQHVNYLSLVGAELHVYELWWDSSGWHANDLTAAASAPLADSDSALSSYAFENQYTQHVNYIGVDSHIHELWRDSSGWHAHDLTAAAG